MAKQSKLPESCWVIGGTSGIGLATVRQLRQMGMDVFSSGMESDVRNVENVRSKLRDAEELVGPLESIVYSAGTNQLDWVGRMDVQGLWDASHVLDTNLLGFITVLDACAEHGRREQQPLRVTVVTSDAAERPLRTSIAYCASKAGLNMAVKVAARELGPHGWRINGVAPGMTDGTEMTDYIDRRVPEVRGWSHEETLRYERSQDVVPGRIPPEQVADAIAQVLTGPDYLNGNITTINGGR